MIGHELLPQRCDTYFNKFGAGTLAVSLVGN